MHSITVCSWWVLQEVWFFSALLWPLGNGPQVQQVVCKGFWRVWQVTIFVRTKYIQKSEERCLQREWDWSSKVSNNKEVRRIQSPLWNFCSNLGIVLLGADGCRCPSCHAIAKVLNWHCQDHLPSQSCTICSHFICVLDWNVLQNRATLPPTTRELTHTSQCRYTKPDQISLGSHFESIGVRWWILDTSQKFRVKLDLFSSTTSWNVPNFLCGPSELLVPCLFFSPIDYRCTDDHSILLCLRF